MCVCLCRPALVCLTLKMLPTCSEKSVTCYYLRRAHSTRRHTSTTPRWEPEISRKARDFSEIRKCRETAWRPSTRDKFLAVLPELFSPSFNGCVCVCLSHIVMRGNITYSTVLFRDVDSKRPTVLHRVHSLTTNRSLSVRFSKGTSLQAE